MALEYELKFCGVEHDAVRQALRVAGAKYKSKYFEENLVLDDAGRHLKEQGVLLRLRRTPHGRKLTLKAPGPDTAGAKVRREYEFGVDNFEAALQIFSVLGYEPAFAYEKVREKWEMGNVLVCLDSLPFGEFVELEAGAETELMDVARRLGLPEDAASNATYHALNRRWRSEQGLNESEEFVFSAERRADLLLEFSDERDSTSA
ncbi:MAG: class IV adenylate cyclase [Desulfovibrionaceae bacterium]